MPKKSRFKQKVGQSVKFKYYDGSVHDGIIVQNNYRNEDSESLPTQWTMPVYTVHSPDNSGRYSRGYMSYPSITQNMIKNILDTTVKIVPMENYVKPKDTNIIKPMFSQSNKAIIARHKTKLSSELDDAINKQKDFIGGKVNN